MVSENRLDRRAVREAIFEAMKGDEIPNQFNSLSYDVDKILSRRGYGEADGVYNSLRGAPLRGRAEKILRELFWELMFQGIFMPGCDSNNPALPFFSMTEFGEKQVCTNQVAPADPDGFIATIARECPLLDPNLIIYVSEALEAFNRYMYLAACVMLGVAAEGLMEKLAEAIRDSHENSEQGEDWFNKKIKSRPALNQYEEVRKKLDPIKAFMPQVIKENYDVHLLGIYSLLRTHRNDSGHPTGVRKQRDEVLPLFYLFTSQARILANITSWLRDQNRIGV